MYLKKEYCDIAALLFCIPDPAPTSVSLDPVLFSQEPFSSIMCNDFICLHLFVFGSTCMPCFTCGGWRAVSMRLFSPCLMQPFRWEGVDCLDSHCPCWLGHLIWNSLTFHCRPFLFFFFLFNNVYLNPLFQSTCIYLIFYGFCLCI